MPVITIKVGTDVFNVLKEKNPYHGAISRIVRSAIRGINKGVEFNPEGSIIRINQVPVAILPTSTLLSLFDLIKDDQEIVDLAKKSASNVNELFNSSGVYGKDAVQKLFDSLEVSNLITFKWVQEENSEVILIYIEKCLFSPRIIKLYFNEYIDYFCQINRLKLEISGPDNSPVYRITKSDGGVFI